MFTSKNNLTMPFAGKDWQNLTTDTELLLVESDKTHMAKQFDSFLQNMVLLITHLCIYPAELRTYIYVKSAYV